MSGPSLISTKGPVLCNLLRGQQINRWTKYTIPGPLPKYNSFQGFFLKNMEKKRQLVGALLYLASYPKELSLFVNLHPRNILKQWEAYAEMAYSAKKN